MSRIACTRSRERGLGTDLLHGSLKIRIGQMCDVSDTGSWTITLRLLTWCRTSTLHSIHAATGPYAAAFPLTAIHSLSVSTLETEGSNMHHSCYLVGG
jgi:hypothetical protein